MFNNLPNLWELDSRKAQIWAWAARLHLGHNLNHYAIQHPRKHLAECGPGNADPDPRRVKKSFSADTHVLCLSRLSLQVEEVVQQYPTIYQVQIINQNEIHYSAGPDLKINYHPKESATELKL